MRWGLHANVEPPVSDVLITELKYAMQQMYSFREVASKSRGETCAGRWNEEGILTNQVAIIPKLFLNLYESSGTASMCEFANQER